MSTEKVSGTQNMETTQNLKNTGYMDTGNNVGQGSVGGLPQVVGCHASPSPPAGGQKFCGSSVDGYLVSHYVNKTVPFRFRGIDFNFDLSHGLFSCDHIDSGTQLLLQILSQILDEEKAAGRPLPCRVLDAGCGTGVIGICAAAALCSPGQEVKVRSQDRDELARLITLHNAAKNNIPPAALEAYTEPLLAGTPAAAPSGEGWDMILSNIPAKAGAPVLEDFIRRSASLLNPGGRVVIVVVHTLADFFRGEIAAAGAELLLEKKGSAHSVFVYGRAELDPSVSEDAPAGSAARGGRQLLGFSAAGDHRENLITMRTEKVSGTQNVETAENLEINEYLDTGNNAGQGSAGGLLQVVGCHALRSPPGNFREYCGTSSDVDGSFLTRYPFYVRGRVQCVIEDTPVNIETIHGAAGFDAPGGAVLAAAKLARRILPGKLPSGAPLLVHEPFQGFFPRWLLEFLHKEGFELDPPLSEDAPAGSAARCGRQLLGFSAAGDHGENFVTMSTEKVSGTQNVKTIENLEINEYLDTGNNAGQGSAGGLPQVVGCYALRSPPGDYQDFSEASSDTGRTLVLSGRNILALEAARHNIPQAYIVPAVDLHLGSAALLEAAGQQYGLIAAFPELLPHSSLPKTKEGRQPADQLASLWESLPALLADGGIFIAACGSSDAERFDRKKPQGGAYQFSRLGSIKRHGFRALAYQYYFR